jgi:hypothetical protein
MNAITAASAYAKTSFSSARETPAPSGSNKGIRLNGLVVIFSASIVLALATASECQSVIHLPSLMYGAVLWGWWGVVTSVIWKLGQRVPFT